MNTSKVICNVNLNGDNLEEVECFRYLGIDMAANGTKRAEVSHRVCVWGGPGLIEECVEREVTVSKSKDGYIRWYRHSVRVVWIRGSTFTKYVKK